MTSDSEATVVEWERGHYAHMRAYAADLCLRIENGEPDPQPKSTEQEMHQAWLFAHQPQLAQAKAAGEKEYKWALMLVAQGNHVGPCPADCPHGAAE